MYLAHILLPAMMIVICRSQQPPSSHYAYGSDESINFFGNQPVPSETPSTPTGNDELLDRYRQLISKSLLKLYDSCKVHDFLQNLKHNMENDFDEEDSSEKFPQRNHQQRYISTLLRMLERQRDGDVTLPTELNSKSAFYYYVSISMLLQDKELDDTLSFMLHDKCCKNDANFFDSAICSQSDNSMTDKRNTIKKVKFHSWGGKRSGGNGQNNARIPTNIDLSKDLGQSKIVIRTPFRPWGGKRLAPDSN